MNFWDRVLQGIGLFYEAHRAFFQFVLRVFGGLLGIVGWVALVLIISFVTYVVTGLQERVLAWCWRRGVWGKIGVIATAILLYFSLGALEVGVLFAFFPFIQLWFHIVVMLVVNGLAILYHSRHEAFWPAWVIGYKTPDFVHVTADPHALAFASFEGDERAMSEGRKPLVRTKGRELTAFEVGETRVRVSPDGQNPVWLNLTDVEVTPGKRTWRKPKAKVVAAAAAATA